MKQANARTSRVNATLKYLLLAAALAAAVLLGLSAGTEFISPGRLPAVLSGQGDAGLRAIVIGIRLPRIILAIIIGASLAVSGTVFQAVLRNPLADPYIIGVSSGAALGAAIAIITGAGAVFLTAASFAGSLVAITGVFFISRRLKPGATPLILAGIALSFILSSTVLLLFAFARSEEVHRALIWLMGDLSAGRADLILPMGGAALFLSLMIFLYHKHCDILSMGEAFSRGAGVTRGDVRVLYWSAALLAALSVALAGVIGFVGLIIPHLMRYFFGPRHLKLFPAAALGGALFLLLSDTIGRSAVPPYEIPTGIITGFFGGIFFLAYLVTGQGAQE